MKSRILALLAEDHEFRLSVAGLVGLKEVLDRIEEHDRKWRLLGRGGVFSQNRLSERV